MPMSVVNQYLPGAVLIVSIIARALSSPVPGSSEWKIGELPTNEQSDASQWYQPAAWDRDEGSFGFGTSLIPMSFPTDVSNGGNHGVAELPSLQSHLYEASHDRQLEESVFHPLPHVRSPTGEATLAWHAPSSHASTQAPLDLQAHQQSLLGTLHQDEIHSAALHSESQPQLESFGWVGTGAAPSPRQELALHPDRPGWRALNSPLPTDPSSERLTGAHSSSLRSDREPIGGQGSENPSSSPSHLEGPTGLLQRVEGQTSQHLGHQNVRQEPQLPPGLGKITEADEAHATRSSGEEAESTHRLWRFLSIFKGSRQAENRWKETVKRVLGMKDLQLSPLASHDQDKDQVYVGHVGDAVHGLHPPVPSPSQAVPYAPRGVGHFLRNFVHVRMQKTTDLVLGRPKERIYIYLNSRANLDQLNEMYFLNHLQFLPVRIELLSWSFLNALYLRRVHHYVLPPRGSNGLPLVLTRHDGPRSGPVSYIQKLTGQVNTGQTVSLWSPVLHENGRYTVILYGVGQLDYRNSIAVWQHLKQLSDITPPSLYYSVYDVTKLAH